MHKHGKCASMRTNEIAGWELLKYSSYSALYQISCFQWCYIHKHFVLSCISIKIHGMFSSHIFQVCLHFPYLRKISGHYFSCKMNRMYGLLSKLFVLWSRPFFMDETEAHTFSFDSISYHSPQLALSPFII